MHLRTKPGTTGSTSQELSAQNVAELQSPSALDMPSQEVSREEPVVEEIESPTMQKQGLGSAARWNQERDIKDQLLSPDVKYPPNVSPLETSMGSFASGPRRSR